MKGPDCDCGRSAVELNAEPRLLFGLANCGSAWRLAVFDLASRRNPATPGVINEKYHRKRRIEHPHFCRKWCLERFSVFRKPGNRFVVFPYRDAGICCTRFD